MFLLDHIYRLPIWFMRDYKREHAIRRTNTWTKEMYSNTIFIAIQSLYRWGLIIRDFVEK